jgi:hypothetical protein
MADIHLFFQPACTGPNYHDTEQFRIITKGFLMYPHYGIDAPLHVRNVLLAGLAMLANAGSLVLRVAGQVWSIVRDKLLTMVSAGAYQPATVIAR